MAKDAFDMLAETVSDMNRMLIDLATKVSAHAVWITIFSMMLAAVFAALAALLAGKI